MPVLEQCVGQALLLQMQSIQTRASAAHILVLRVADALQLFLPSRADAGEGDLQIDGLRARLCEQLPLWFLWRCRPVRCSRFPSGGLASATFSIAAPFATSPHL